MIQSLGLVYKPAEGPTRVAMPPVRMIAEEIGKSTHGVQIPVEEVDVAPGCRLAVYSDSRGLAADRFRYLRLRLRELSTSGTVRTILISSPLPQDGKSTVALNLATALADHGRCSVLLIEADLYHPVLTQVLGLKSWTGLAECLENRASPLSTIRRIVPLGWCLMPAGKPVGNPGDMLHTGAFADMMRAMAPLFDWILLDSPPLVPLTDALELARHADAGLLVVRADRTPREAVNAALAALGPRFVAGIVLNGAHGLERRYSKYYGYYGHTSKAGRHEHEG